MKIVITGAGGFLGSHLVPELIKGGHSISAVMAKLVEDADGQGVEPLGPDLLQVNDWPSLASELEDADVLLNCAFPRNTNGFDMADGLLFLERVFTLGGGSRIGAVINISSQSVYDPHRTSAADEASDPCPTTTYAVGKCASELMLDLACGDKPHTNVRLASLIGPGFDQRVVNKMARIAIDEGAITAIDGKSRFGFLDIEDAVPGLVLLCESAGITEWAPAYNLGIDGSYSLPEIANAVADVCHELARDVRVETKPSDSDQWTDSTIDASLFKATFQWQPRLSLHDSARAIVNDILEKDA